MFYSIVSIWRITTTITGRNALTFITGEMLVTVRKKFSSAGTSPVLTYTNIHTESSSAATTIGVTHIFAMNTTQLPPLSVVTQHLSVVC